MTEKITGTTPYTPNNSNDYSSFEDRITNLTSQNFIFGRGRSTQPSSAQQNRNNSPANYNHPENYDLPAPPPSYPDAIRQPPAYTPDNPHTTNFTNRSGSSKHFTEPNGDDASKPPSYSKATGGSKPYNRTKESAKDLGKVLGVLAAGPTLEVAALTAFVTGSIAVTLGASEAAKKKKEE